MDKNDYLNGQIKFKLKTINSIYGRLFSESTIYQQRGA